MSDLEVINVERWIEENRDQFLPPVCNKLMHNSQLMIMYVGGPNIRSDFHIEEGEEFFYQAHGDMLLKIVERGCHKDVVIKQGQVFLLPARIPHSPQRYPNTVGLVIERKRNPDELDVLRYHCPGESTAPLYEKQFYCEDLGVQLKPIIEAYFASEEKRTGKPSKNSVLDKLPFDLDEETVVMEPFDLAEKLATIGADEKLFKGEWQSDISVLTEGSDSLKSAFGGDHWIWQREGRSRIVIDRKVFCLAPDDTLLVPIGYTYRWEREPCSKAIRIKQHLK